MPANTAAASCCPEGNTDIMAMQTHLTAHARAELDCGHFHLVPIGTNYTWCTWCADTVKGGRTGRLTRAARAAHDPL